MAAEVLVLLTDVDGLYTARPGEPGARLVSRVHDMDQLEEYSISGRGSSVGTGGMTTKIDAAMIATHSGVPTLLANAEQAWLTHCWAARWGRGSTSPTTAAQPAALARLGGPGAGHVVLDDGAVDAVTTGSASSCAAGITRVDGDFEAGDPIELVAPDGRVVARGLSGYDARDVARMMGRSSVQLRVELGEMNARPVVHRDDLAPVRRTGGR